MRSIGPVTASVRSPALRAFRSLDFRRFLGSRLLAILGLEMMNVAVGWQVYALTRRPLDLGYVGLAQFLPALFLTLPAGHAADRFDRRRVMLLCHLGFGLCAALLAWLALTDIRTPVPIFAVLVLLGTARAFNAPAAQALMPSLAARGRLPQRRRLELEHLPGGATWSARRSGGGLYALFGDPEAVYLLAAALAVLDVIVLAGIRDPDRPHGVEGDVLVHRPRRRALRLGEQGRPGLHLARPVRGAARRRRRSDAGVRAGRAPHRRLGARRPPERARPSARAGGALPRRPPAQAPRGTHDARRRRASSGRATIGFGLSRSLWLSVLLLVVMGAADMLSVFVRLTLVQISPPPEMRGRVNAVNMLFIGASNELGRVRVRAHRPVARPGARRGRRRRRHAARRPRLDPALSRPRSARSAANGIGGSPAGTSNPAAAEASRSHRSDSARFGGGDVRA